MDRHDGAGQRHPLHDCRRREGHLDHRFGSCSRSQTFANRNLATAPEVICIPGPCSGSISSYRSFNYSSGTPGGPITSLNGLFVSRNRAEGLVGFRDLPQCGTATGIAWSAGSR